MDPITMIIAAMLGINALGAKRAYDSEKPDEYGMNEVDRQYIQRLQQDVLQGKMTEEEARAKLGSKWKGTADYNKAYDYVSSLGEGGVNTLFGNAGGINLNGLIDSIIAHYTGAELTGAEREMNAFNAAEAQKSRDFTQFMAENKYSMETQSMAAAGVNPAVVYGGGNLVPTAANGAQASGHLGGTGDLVGALTSLMRMPAELAKLKAEAVKATKEGDAALINAGANEQNADSNARNAGSNERQASAAERQAAVAEAEVDIKRTLADNNTRATDAQIKLWAEQEAQIAEQIKYIPTYAEAELKKASAAQTSAYAAIQNAKAALQNAASTAKLTDSQVLLNAVVRQKESIYRDYLPAQLSAQVDEMKARGYYWNEQGQLVDKQGKLVDAQVVHEYISIGCDVAKTACNIAGTIATGGAGGVLVKDSVPEGRPATYSSTPAGYGTYYDPD